MPCCSKDHKFQRIPGDLSSDDEYYGKGNEYLKYKERLKLFYKYCCDFRENYYRNTVKSANLQDQDNHHHLHQRPSLLLTRKMYKSNRSGIDFAAIEASAEAFEVIDAFAAKTPHGSVENFLEAERINTNFRENYFEDDIEIINGVEAEYEERLQDFEAEDEAIYHNPTLGELHEGVSFTVTGRTKRHCERFSINFIVENATRDLALHINPRLPQNYIVRNSKVRNVWGREEVASALPFSLRRGAPFSIQVLFTEECYMISVNGYHFCKFYHRLPYKSVQTMEVKGDIDDVSVERMIVSHYPERLPESIPKSIRLHKSLRAGHDPDEEGGDLTDHEEKQATQWREVVVKDKICHEPNILRKDEMKLPYYGVIPKNSFLLGHVIKIEGRVRLLPQSFYINLQSGHDCWPHPTIALHLNPRFSKQSVGPIGQTTVIRNSWVDGSWGTEERSDMETTFRPGKTFSLSIVHGSNNSFEIYVNHELLTEYKFRCRPDKIDTIYIQGDIKLFDVVLQRNTSFEKISPHRRAIEDFFLHS
ncbi:hypothetical protein FF38_07169 [Lucilia cuprina]|uniref:Galectin n=1 Tax=Lucilia cuprina TaxID=7375 RepID=A0A0L0BSQ9_LUCCU|nr:hypothetical protein FF38_07169 [Lucilia cuprina]